MREEALDTLDEALGVAAVLEDGDQNQLLALDGVLAGSISADVQPVSTTGFLEFEFDFEFLSAV